MLRRDEKEKRNQKVGGIATIVVHVLFLLIAFFLTTCWKAPGPPNSNQDIGLLLDMGSMDFGSGELRSESDPNEVKEVPDEVSEETSQSAAPAETVESVDNDVPDAQTIEEPSPVTSSPKPVVAKPSPKPVEKPVEKPTPVTKPNPTPTPVTKPTTTNGTPAPNNNGPDSKKPGDAGSENSTDTRNVYTGNQGGGKDGAEGSDGSFSVNVGGGWKFSGQPKEDRITHSGTIEFSFTVDEFGDISKVTIIRSSFTPDEEKMLIHKIQNELTFRQTTSVRPPEETKGSVIWKFKAK